MNVTPQKSFFRMTDPSGSPVVESDDEVSSLIHLSSSTSSSSEYGCSSALSSHITSCLWAYGYGSTPSSNTRSSLSADGYRSSESSFTTISSPFACSICRSSCTTDSGNSPTEMCHQSDSDCPSSSETEGPESRRHLFDLHASSVEKKPLNKTQDSPGQHKGKMGLDTDVEVVEENPMKGTIKMIPITTSMCLTGKDRQNETPKQKSQKLVFEESSDIVSATAPVKALQKPNPDYEANTEQTHFTSQTLSCPSDGCACEASTEENQKESMIIEEEYTIENDGEKENHNKYFPVFYKSSAVETLTE